MEDVSGLTDKIYFSHEELSNACETTLQISNICESIFHEPTHDFIDSKCNYNAKTIRKTITEFGKFTTGIDDKLYHMILVILENRKAKIIDRSSKISKFSFTKKELKFKKILIGWIFKYNMI